MTMKNKIVFIVGPTSSGKTDLAVLICKKFNGEIISADSRQVYRGLDIGTGKEGICKNDKCQISNAKLRIDFIKCRARWISGVPQYLIDIVEPGGEMYNLKNFIDDANLCIRDIQNREKLPVVIGGTGLYVSALTEGYQLSKHKQERGEWAKKKESNFDNLILAVDVPREELYRRIDERLEKRINQGLIAEVSNLIDRGVSTDWLQKIGLEYRFVSQRLMGTIKTDGELFDKLRFAIHGYARRQLTWLRHKISRVEWVMSSDEAVIKTHNFLRKGTGPGRHS